MMNIHCLRTFSKLITHKSFNFEKSTANLTTWFNKSLTNGYISSHIQTKKYSTVITSTTNSKEWNRAVWDAEKLVGYPTSYLSLRFLLSDEFSNTAMHFRKLIGTNHPFMTTLKRLIYDGRNNLQTRGLFILLLSKAMGHPEDKSVDGPVSSEQRSLAEITELVHTAQLIHEAILNIPEIESQEQQDLQSGNKLSVLAGDYLLASACKSLAELRNCKVVDLISSSISDLMQASFMAEQQDKAGNSIPSEGLLTVQDWEEQTFLKAGSLLANSCQAVAELAGHDNEVQKHAFNFGQSLAYTWQLHLELQPFSESSQPGYNFHLTSLPVLLHLAENKDDLAYVQSTANSIDYVKLHKAITNGEGVIKSNALLDLYIKRTNENLEKFKSSEATKALSNLIHTMRSG